MVYLVWCLAFATYLLFAGRVSLDEVLTAGVVSCLATSWTFLVRRTSQLRFAFTVGAVSHLLRALSRLPSGAARAGGVLIKIAGQGGSPGRPEERRFRYGGTGAVHRTRRALVVLGASLAPDRFVVEIVHARDIALLHDVLRGSRVLDEWWLE